MITRIGSGAATAATQSPPPDVTKSSSSSAAMALVAAVKRATLRGVNSRLTIRRSRLCSGASVSMTERRASSASASRSQRLVCPIPDEKISGCRDTLRTSPWRVTAQKPPDSYRCHRRPGVARMAAKRSCGMPSRYRPGAVTSGAPPAAAREWVFWEPFAAVTSAAVAVVMVRPPPRRRPGV